MKECLPIGLPDPQQASPVKIGVRNSGRCFDQHQPNTRVAIIPAAMQEACDCFCLVVSNCFASDYLPLLCANFIKEERFHFFVICAVSRWLVNAMFGRCVVLPTFVPSSTHTAFYPLVDKVVD